MSIFKLFEKTLNMEKKILITGSTGFIGFNILNHLAKNNNITIVLRKKNNKIFDIVKKNKIKIIYYNNLNQLNNSLKKLRIDVVIHCATHYTKKHSYKDIYKLNYSNILFGNLILENFKHLKFKKFINFTTVWENYNGIKNNPFNLYAAYKQSFTRILNYYKSVDDNGKYYNVYLSETFGAYDTRQKLIRVLKNNFRKKLTTILVSNNLFINVLNIKDLLKALDILLKTNIKEDNYLAINSFKLKITDLIKYINKVSNKKIKVKYLSNKVINEKIYTYKILPKWKPTNSKLKDISNFILN